MGIAEKFQKISFTTTTDKSFEELVEIADGVASRASGMITSVKKVLADPDVGIAYQVRRAGTLWVGDIHVGYERAGEGATVTMSAPEYMSSRPTFMFIPVGPEESAAFPAARTFSRLLQEAL